MKLGIYFDVEEEVARKCSEITGLETVIKPDYATEVELIMKKFIAGPETVLIQTVSAGVDHIDHSSIPENVTFCSNADAFSDPVAEHAFALILSYARKIGIFDSMTKKGTWEKLPIISMKYRKLGILGYGGIGRSCARIGKALGMDVLAYTRTRKNDENVDRFVDSSSAVFEESDVVIIGLPLTKLTRGMVGDELLSKFSGKIIVNVARADIVDRNAMLKFLKNNPDKEYLTDVWWGEPKIGKEVPENAILTPHIAGLSPDLVQDAVIHACVNIKDYLNGKPSNVVRREDYR